MPYRLINSSVEAFCRLKVLSSAPNFVTFHRRTFNRNSIYRILAFCSLISIQNFIQKLQFVFPESLLFKKMKVPHNEENLPNTKIGEFQPQSHNEYHFVIFFFSHTKESFLVELPRGYCLRNVSFFFENFPHGKNILQTQI